MDGSVRWSLTYHPSMACVPRCKLSKDIRWSLNEGQKTLALYHPGGWRIIVINWTRRRIVFATLWMKRKLIWATWKRIFSLSWCSLLTSSTSQGSWTPSLRYFFPLTFSNVVAKVVAVRLEGKTAVQIRQEFGIEADLTDEEVEAIQKEEEWDTLVESLSG